MGDQCLLTVGQLEKILAQVENKDMPVLLPRDPGVFDGFFVQACSVNSGPAQLGAVPGVEGIHVDEFVIAPCGFYETGETDEEEL